jgi:hypothetical protein
MFRETMTSMPETARNGNQEGSVTQLVSGIVDDAQELLRQQISLLKHEVRRDIQEAKQLSISFVAGVSVAAMAGILWCFTLVYLVNWLWPVIPMWGSFAIIGAICTVIAAACFYLAKEKLEEITTPLSEEAQQAIKENVQWTTKPK